LRAVQTLVRNVAVAALLAVPLLMVFGLSQLAGFLGPVLTATNSATALQVVVVPRPTAALSSRIAPVVETPPPTLAPPTPTAAPATPIGTPRTQGQPATIGNTDGRGAVLRADPVSGRQVAALRDRQVVYVLDRTRAGGAEWAHVRTTEGAEGWVISVVLQPQAQP
jgi:hypothetical protein